MPTAHEDNGGIQVFSRTQSAETIQRVLGDQGYGEFEAETYSTATAPESAPIVELNEDGTPKVAPVDPAAAPPVEAKPPRPGRRERELAKTKAALDKTREELAELRGMVMGQQGAVKPPIAEVNPAAVAKPEEVTPPPLEIAKFDKPRPKRDDFFDAADPETAYEDAVGDWKYEAREFDKTARQQAEQRQQEAVKVQTTQRTAAQRWTDALAEARTDYKDFDVVISKSHFDKNKKPLAVVSPPMTFIAQNRKQGAKILYWLGTHPEEANKIAVKTSIADSSDAWAVEEAMAEVRREFDRIEQELAAAPPAKPAVVPPATKADPVEEDEDDEFEDDDERAEDPYLQAVGSDPREGRQVVQPPARGTVDTKPPAVHQPPAAPAVQAKPDPVSRVGQRGGGVNRRLLDTPVEVLRQTLPTDYRKKRELEGSSAARG